MPRPASNKININIKVNVDQAVQSVERLTGSITKANEAAKKISTTTAQHVEKPIKEATNKSQKYLHNLIGAFTNLQTVVKSVGLAMGVGFGVFALGTVMRRTVESFNEIEQGMRKIWTVTNLTNKELKELQSNLLDLARTTTLSMKDIMEGAYYALSSGIRTDELVKFMEIANKAAVAGYASMKDTVDLLTTIKNAYGYSVNYMTNVADKLFASMYVAKAEFQDFAVNLGKVIPTAAQLGISLDEVLASVSALTKVGISTDKAATYIAQFMNSVIKPSAEAKKEAEELGIQLNATALSAYGLGGYLKYMVDKMKDAGLSSEEMVSAIAKITGEVRAARAVFGLMSQDFSILNDAMNQITDSTGKVEDAYEKASKTLQRAWEEMKKTLTIGAASVVNATTDTVGLLNGFFKKVFDKMDVYGEEYFSRLASSASEVGENIEEIGTKISATTQLIKDNVTSLPNIFDSLQLALNELGLNMQKIATLEGVGDFEAVQQVLENLRNEFKKLGFEIDETVNSLEEFYNLLLEQNRKKVDELTTSIEDASKKLRDYKQQYNDLTNQLKQLETIGNIARSLVGGFNVFDEILKGNIDINYARKFALNFFKQLRDVFSSSEEYKPFVDILDDYLEALSNETLTNNEFVETIRSFTQIYANQWRTAVENLSESFEESKKKLEENKPEIEIKIKTAEEEIKKFQEKKKRLEELIEKSTPEAIMQKAVENSINTLQQKLKIYFEALKDSVLVPLVHDLPKDVNEAFENIIKYTTMSSEEILKNPEKYLEGLTSALKVVNDFIINNQEKLSAELANNPALNYIFGVILKNSTQAVENLSNLLVGDLSEAININSDKALEFANELLSVNNALNELQKSVGKTSKVTTEEGNTLTDAWKNFREEVGRLQALFKLGTISFDEYMQSVSLLVKKYYTKDLENDFLNFFVSLQSEIDSFYSTQLRKVQLLDDINKQKEALLELIRMVQQFKEELETALGEELYNKLNVAPLIGSILSDLSAQVTDITKQQFEDLMKKFSEAITPKTFAEIQKFMDEQYSKQLKIFNIQLLNAKNEDEKIAIYKQQLDYLDTVYKKLESIKDFISPADESEYLNYLQDVLEKREQIKQTLSDMYEINVDLTTGEKQRIRELRNALELSSDFDSKYQELFKRVVEVRKQIGVATTQEDLQKLKAELNEAKNELNDLSDVATKLGRRNELKSLNNFIENLDSKIENTLNNAIKYSEEYAQKLDDLIKLNKTWSDSYIEVLTKFSETRKQLANATDIETVKDLAERLKKLKEQIKKLQQIAIKTNNTEEWLFLQKLINKELEQTETKMANINKELDKINELQKTFRILKQYSHLFGDFSNVINSFADGFLTAFDDIKEDLIKGKIGWQDAITQATIKGVEASAEELEEFFKSWGNEIGDLLAQGVRTYEWAKLGSEIGRIIGTAFGSPEMGSAIGTIIGTIISIFEWAIDFFKSEWQKTYEEIRKNLPDTISSALKSVRTPEELKKQLKQSIFNAAYSGLVDAFLKTSYMQTFMDNMSKYMADFITGKITAEQFKEFVDKNIEAINWDKLSEALKYFYDSMVDASETAKATEESLAYSSVRTVTEQTANIMVSYLRDMRDTLHRIAHIAQKIQSNTSQRYKPPFRGAVLE